MTRPWPIPRTENTLLCIGDLHVDPGFRYEVRRDFVLRDLDHPTVPAFETYLQLGDFANTADLDEYAAGKEFMDSLGGDWWAVVGNHDMWYPGDSTGTQPHRTAAAAAADLGMPAASYTVDLGYAVLLALGPTTSSMTFDPEWLNTQLVANAGRTCLIAAHAPLYETVGVGSTDVATSVDSGFFASGTTFGIDADIRAVLADNPNAKAWISGHTHSLLTDNYLVKPEQVGGHILAAINCSSIAYVGDTAEWYDPVATLAVTVEDDRIDVRFRDHGSHAWVGGSHEHKRCWSVTL